MESNSATVNRALWLESFNKPATLVDLPIPEAHAGTAVIKVLAAPIVPYTKLAHTGKLPQLNLALPLVPNPNAVGRVHAVGPDSVRLKPGDLVYLDCTVHGRDDPSVMIMAGHHGGEGPAGRKLMQGEWRDGSLQQYQKIPLENVYPLNEKILLGDQGLTPSHLLAIAHLSVAGGGILEAAAVQAAETVVVGPCGGSFGGMAVEIALAVGANVIGVGRDDQAIATLSEGLRNHPRFTPVILKGENDAEDIAAILAATPGQRGADVVSDWSPGALDHPPFLRLMTQTIKSGGRIVLSGGTPGKIDLPYTFMVHKNISLRGKWMCSRSTLERLINMVEQKVLDLGDAAGTQIKNFSLDDHEEAIDYAAVHGGWRNYTVVKPNGDE